MAGRLAKYWLCIGLKLVIASVYREIVLTSRGVWLKALSWLFDLVNADLHLDLLPCFIFPINL